MPNWLNQPMHAHYNAAASASLRAARAEADRTRSMRGFAAMARERDAAGDVVLRSQAADSWRELATAAEASRAPRYLTWRGR